MTRKKVIIERMNVSRLRPTKVRPFSVKKFMEAAENLEEALKKEEKKYGRSSQIFA